MEFGKRLSRAGGAPPPSSSSSGSSSALARLGGFLSRHPLLLMAASVLLAVLLLPVHLSTGEPCHSRLAGLVRGAYSSHTRELSLARCGLLELPPALLTLGELRRLDLSGNRLSSLPRGFSRALPRLEVLFLSQNQFSGELDPVTAGELLALPSLRMLAFRDNNLSSISVPAFPEKLEWLILTSNRLSRVDSLPRSLRKLLLSNNALTRLPDTLLQADRLELLRLANNRLPSSELARLDALPSLRWLAVADNPLPQDLLSAPGLSSVLLNEPQKTALLRGLSTAVRLGEGSAGVTYLTQHGTEKVIYKRLKNTALTSDGRIESEFINAVFALPKNVSSASTEHVPLQELVGITVNPLGVLYRFRESQRNFKSLGNPPSFDSCTRDTYPEERRFSRQIVETVLRDVLSGLAILHEQGVVHGDLYAHNIQYDPDTGRAMVLDLGASFRGGERVGGVMEWRVGKHLDERAYRVLADELRARVDPPLSEKERETMEAAEGKKNETRA